MNAIIGLILRIILLVLLYAFLGSALWLIWKSVIAKTGSPTQVEVPTLTISSSHAGIEQAQEFTIPELSIGRDPECDYVLDDALVSARHGRLSFYQGQWWYEDLKSTNGSFLDDLRIEEPIVIKDGDSIFCGEIAFKVKIS